MKESKVSSYMTSHPHTIGSEQTLAVAHRILSEHGIHHLPVLHGGQLTGIVTLRDLEMVERLSDVDRESLTVEEAMTGEVYEVDPDARLGSVAVHMAEHRISSAIVTKNGKLQGVFTTVDALRALADALR